MDDRYNEILSQYELTVYRSCRARGGLYLDTDCGPRYLAPCKSSERRLQFENLLKKQLIDRGYPNIDSILPTRDQKLIAEAANGDRYCLYSWYPLEECSLRNEEHLIAASKNLALLHKAMQKLSIPESDEFIQPPLTDTLLRRNRELKRVRNFLTQRLGRTAFEIRYLNCCAEFYEEAEYAYSLLPDNADTYYREVLNNGFAKHGSYTYHNILTTPKSAGDSFFSADHLKIATVCFDKAAFGPQIDDLYQFLRKAMEKNAWDYEIGKRMLDSYDHINPINSVDFACLKAMLHYPEKFWKITNQYYNSRKSLIPQKNIDKLEVLLGQQKARHAFLSML